MKLQPFDLDRIQASGLVREVEFHEEIGSTNDRAAELVSGGPLGCPFLVLTAKQTGGRGRGSNRWWSAPGALTFSLVLDAENVGLPTERWPQIALAVGAAVGDAIEESIPQAVVHLKWPNDVYLAGKKTGGILVEMPATARGQLIVGIGLNVNNSLADAPLELGQIATSMTDEARQTFDATEVLLAILTHFSEWRTSLAVDERAVFARWRTRCLLTGKRVCLIAGSQQVTGLCRGIDDMGRLVLSTAAGTNSYLSGTVVSFE